MYQSEGGFLVCCMSSEIQGSDYTDHLNDTSDDSAEDHSRFKSKMASKKRRRDCYSPIRMDFMDSHDSSVDSEEKCIPIPEEQSTDSSCSKSSSQSQSFETSHDYSQMFPDCRADRNEEVVQTCANEKRGASVPLKKETSVYVDPVLKKEDGARSYNKKHNCLYCGKAVHKISRHLYRSHKNVVDVAKAFRLPKNSKERRLQLDRIRNKGNFEHNAEVLKGQKGKLIPSRQPKKETEGQAFLHCIHCYGLFKRKVMWRHWLACKFKPQTFKLSKKRVKVLCTYVEPAPTGFSDSYWKFISEMNKDSIAVAVKQDQDILQYGYRLFKKIGSVVSQLQYIRQKLRELGRFLLAAKKITPVNSIRELIKPKMYDHVVTAGRCIAGFINETGKCQHPSVAHKIGRSLRALAMFIMSEALKNKDEQTAQDAEEFAQLYQERWKFDITSQAPTHLDQAKRNSPQHLLLTQDFQILHSHLHEKWQQHLNALKEEASPSNWIDFAKVTLTQVILFNRRGEGQVSKMPLSAYLSRDTSEEHENGLNLALTPLEQRLCQHFVWITIVGKRGRKVPVLLTPLMRESLDTLTDKREECGVLNENGFMFALPHSLHFLRGCDCLKQYVEECKDIKDPKALTSTKFRKRIATLSTILNLETAELDQLADFLRHNIDVHRKPHCLSEDTLWIAKISKVLLAVEQGRQGENQGKNLDQIHTDMNAAQMPEAPGSEDEAPLALQEGTTTVYAQNQRKTSKKRGKKSRTYSRERGQRKSRKKENKNKQSERNTEKNKDVNMEKEEETKYAPVECAEDSKATEPSIYFSDDNEDMNVDFDIDNDRIMVDVVDGHTNGSAAKHEIKDGKDITVEDNKSKESSDRKKKDTSLNEHSIDGDPKETMDISAENHVAEDYDEDDDWMDVDSNASAPTLNAAIEKSPTLSVAVTGLKEVRIVIPKLDIAKVQNPIHISQFSSVSNKQPVKDEPTCDDKKQSATPSPLTEVANKPSYTKEVPMNCSCCKKNMVKEQTAYQKAGLTDVFCSKNCLFEMFPHNEPTTKLCYYCYKVISQPVDLIMAAVDTKGTMKDFCSPACLCSFKYSSTSSQTQLSICSMCNKSSTIECELTLNEAICKFCSHTCLEDFCKSNVGICENCSCVCRKKPLVLKLKDGTKTICSADCLEEFKENNKTPHQCSLCLSVCPVSDMVAFKNEENIVELFCSCHCLISCKPRPIVQHIVQAKKIISEECWMSKTGNQSKEKTNTEDIKVDSASSANENDASPAAEPDSPLLLIFADICTFCSNCKKELPEGETLFKPKDTQEVFCSMICFSEIHPNIKLPIKKCYNCFQVMTRPQKMTLAPVDDSGIVKELCSDACFSTVNSKKAATKQSPQEGPISQCRMCAGYCCCKFTMTLNGVVHQLCSDSCFMSYQVNSMGLSLCDMCSTVCLDKGLMVKMKDSSKTLCSDECLAKFREIKEEPMDEVYNQSLLASVFHQDIKDEPTVAKEGLKIASVFSLTGESRPAELSLTSADFLASCSTRNKLPVNGEAVNERNSLTGIFCPTSCLKPVEKTCHFCLQVIIQPQDILQTPVDDEGTKKDFCSRTCLASFDYKRKVTAKIPVAPISSHSQCSICSRYCISKHEITQQVAIHKICSDPCFLRFCKLNNVTVCANCYSYCETPLTLKIEEGNNKLCGAECLAQFKQKIQTPQLCTMCHNTNLISDMVENKNNENVVELFCSSSCVMASKIQVVNTSGTQLNCDSCGKITVPACHVTMSDASIRNFCTLRCAMAFKVIKSPQLPQ